MKASLLACVSWMLLPLAACSINPDIATTVEHGDRMEQDSPGEGGQAEAAQAQPAAMKKEEAEADLDQLEHALAMAQAKLEIAQLEGESSSQKAETDLKFAQEELAMAEADYENFQNIRRPQRLKRERLNLQTAMDRAQEAKDELAQIEIMYDEQDLDDLTAEFVVSRGRRSAERASTRIELQKADFDNLEGHELLSEEQKLRLGVERKRAALRAQERSMQIATRKQAMSILEAERAVSKAGTKLQEAREARDEKASSETEG